MNKHILTIVIICLFFYVIFSCLRNREELTEAQQTNGKPDTTTHDFIWRIDTIGPYSNEVYCVSIIDEKNIWVGGYIQSGDYSAIHWNGQKWDYIVIKENQYNLIMTSIGDIWALSNNEIWLGVGSIYFYDGKIAHISYQRDITKLGGARSLWYNSATDIYGVGSFGHIVHFNGQKWTKKDSVTSYDITDVWGGYRDENKKVVLVTVTNAFEPGTEIRLLSIAEQQVKDTLNWNTGRYLLSVWFDQESPIYVCGGGLWYYQDSSWSRIQLPNYLLRKVRGSAWNNIFVVGSFSFIAHYNGSTWKTYDQLIREHGSLVDVAVTDNLVVAVGDIGREGIIFMGKRKQK